MFQTRGEAQVVCIGDLKPFVHTVRTVELSKDAMGVLAMFGSGVSVGLTKKTTAPPARLSFGADSCRSRLRGADRREIAALADGAGDRGATADGDRGCVDPASSSSFSRRRRTRRRRARRRRDRRGRAHPRRRRTSAPTTRRGRRQNEWRRRPSVSVVDSREKSAAVRGAADLLRLKPCSGLSDVTLVRGEVGGESQRERRPRESRPVLQDRRSAAHVDVPGQAQTVNPVYVREFDFVVTDGPAQSGRGDPGGVLGQGYGGKRFHG